MGILWTIFFTCLFGWVQSADISMTPRSPNCPPQTTNQTYFFPNPYNCSTFYICSNGLAIEQSCPPNLHFNPAVSTCDFPDNANCTEIAQELVYPVSCIDSPLLPSPYDCHFFLSCLQDGYADLIKCPEPLLFNPDILVCDWASNVQCNLSV